jgi:hypothetical protein
VRAEGERESAGQRKGERDGSVKRVWGSLQVAIVKVANL